jgi:hypothetical protein
MRSLFRFFSAAMTVWVAAVHLHARASVDESEIFPFDTRDYYAGLASESAVFAFDTRAADHLSGSAVSDVFVLDTSFTSAPPLNIAGTVRNEGGLPVPGAAVVLKRYETVFWRGTSSADGTFFAPNLSPWNYTVVVTKPGYVTHASSFSGLAGGDQTLDIAIKSIPSAPTPIETVRTPPDTAIRPPAPANPSDPNAPKLMLYDGAGHLTTSLAGLDPNRMTVVMSHGWVPTLGGDVATALDWLTTLASLIHNHNRLAQPPNILVWDWRKQANALSPPIDAAVEQGSELGKALQRELGTGYSQHLHFIGHSLGTIINCYACDYVHGSFVRSGSNPSSKWNALLTTPQVTLLDEAEVATLLGQNVTTAAAIGWRLAQFKGALIASGVAAVADWKNPIPKEAKWVDNYISLVGIQRDGAVNVCLLAPTVSFDWSSPINSLVYAHSYAPLFYGNTVSPLGPAPAVGFEKSYEGGSAFPPGGTGLSAGSLWYEYLATSDLLDLRQDSNPGAFECNLTILSALTVMPAATGVATLGNEAIYKPLDAVGQAVMRQYETGIQWAGNLGGTVIYTTGTVLAGVKEKLGNWWDAAFDTASDTLNSIKPDSQLAGPLAAPVFSLTLGTQAAPPQLAQRGGMEPQGGGPASGQPPYAWVAINVPTNAGLIAFDFTVTGEPQEDRLACAVNGQNVFTLPAKFAPDGSPVSTDMIDISAYAGQSVELFFGLVGGTSTNCAVTVDGIRFITIPQPRVGLALDGPNIAVKWPAAAVGWVLETSETLAPDGWQAVPMTGVTVERGVATIVQSISNLQSFYRLRRIQ